MKKSEIVTKIAENQARQKQNEIEQESNRANSNILSHQLEELKKELAESKKPKLRHGDYGYGSNWREDAIDAFVYTIQSGQGKAFYASGMGQIDTNQSKHPVLGNIFDDLTAMQEEVTEFETNCCLENKHELSVTTSSTTNRTVFTTTNGIDIYVELEDMPSLIRNLQCVMATLKRSKK